MKFVGRVINYDKKFVTDPAVLLDSNHDPDLGLLVKMVELAGPVNETVSLFHKVE